MKLRNLTLIVLLGSAHLAYAFETPAAPTSFSVRHGSRVSGDTFSMLLSDNNRLIIDSRPMPASPRPLAPHEVVVEVTMQRVLPAFFGTNVRRIDYQFEASHSGPGGADFRPIDRNNQAIPVFMPISIPQTESTLNIRLPSFVQARQFVDPLGRLKVRITALGSAPFRLRIDRLTGIITE